MNTRNLYRDDQAQVVMTGEDGLKSFFLVDEVRKTNTALLLMPRLSVRALNRTSRPLPQQHLDEVEQRLRHDQ
ncbi:hypothetical protein QIV92_24335 [Raoultella ornithinolytica]|nr:hypothetical protein [Raoultella ornithinolytica]